MSEFFIVTDSNGFQRCINTSHVIFIRNRDGVRSVHLKGGTVIKATDLISVILESAGGSFLQTTESKSGDTILIGKSFISYGVKRGTKTTFVMDGFGSIDTEYIFSALISDPFITINRVSPTINLAGVPIITGSGAPGGVVSAPNGSLYLNANGGAGATIFVKEGGNGDATNWAPK